MESTARFTIELPTETIEKLADIAKKSKRSKKAQAELLLYMAIERFEY